MTSEYELSRDNAVAAIRLTKATVCPNKLELS